MASEFQVWIYSFGMTHSSSLGGHLRPWKSARAQQTPPVGMWLDPSAPSPSPSHSALGHLALHFPSASLLWTLQSPRLLSHQFTRIIKHPVDKQDRDRILFCVFFFSFFFFPVRALYKKKKNKFFLVVFFKFPDSFFPSFFKVIDFKIYF